ncbi:MAG: hypothetical protein KDD99_24070, partial [Bacteroidetes bacterium]|nr:hypothetical protein [Bacteroidota bacterium]
MEHFHKIFLLLSLFPAFFSLSSAQISGVINQYSEVISIDYANSSVEVADPGFFNVDDRVLLIQMKGAQMVTTNNSFFGDVSNINGAGIYEMATVCDVIGNDVSFQYGIHNTYNPNAVSSPRIQLVKVYSGTNETVSGTVTATPWNGATGGIVAIELTGTLTMNADIDVSEQGFRGGDQYDTPYECQWFTTHTSFFYGFNGGDLRAAKKGEGISEYISGMEYGKGAQVNGGGGGNDHNAGGGGGGNFGFGGNGGTRNAPGFFDCKGNHPGLGGEGLVAFGYSALNNHVFLGGGGGSGEDNNNESHNGGNGGGLVLIIADQIEGNANAIVSNGGTAQDSDS